MVVAFGGVPKFARWPGLIGMALNGFGSLRDSSSNFDPQKNFVFFVFFVEKNRTLISDLTQSIFIVLYQMKIYCNPIWTIGFFINLGAST